MTTTIYKFKNIESRRNIPKPCLKVVDHHTIQKTARNEFLEKLSANSMKPRDYFILFITFLAMLLSVASLFIFQPEIEKIYTLRMETWWGNIAFYVAVSLLIFQTGFFIYLITLYLKYKPIKAVTDELLPTCTVIVPAYNEGKLVYETLLSLADSNYPTDKLQIFSIDDGSKDDTWQWMLKAKEILGDRLHIYQQPVNQGKRRALYRGFQEATGEVFVTVTVIPL